MSEKRFQTAFAHASKVESESRTIQTCPVFFVDYEKVSSMHLSWIPSSSEAATWLCSVFRRVWVESGTEISTPTSKSSWNKSYSWIRSRFVRDCLA